MIIGWAADDRRHAGVAVDSDYRTIPQVPVRFEEAYVTRVTECTFTEFVVGMIPLHAITAGNSGNSSVLGRGDSWLSSALGSP